MNDTETITRQLGGTFQNGRGQCPCPICQPEGRRDQNALSLADTGDKILAHCFKGGCAFADIASAVNLPRGTIQPDHQEQQQAEIKQAAYAAKKLARARSLWDYGKSIIGTQGEKYLRSRGITVELPDSLRWVADLYHAPSGRFCSAIVADVQPTGGAHRTYFDKQGERLSKSAKMMLGPCCGGAVRLSEGAGPLVVAEGIETGLSVAQMLAERLPSVWAALSTSGIKALELPPKPHDLIIASDGDPAGRDASNVLASKASAFGWHVSIMEAPDGQDWNDVLQEGVAA